MAGTDLSLVASLQNQISEEERKTPRFIKMLTQATITASASSKSLPPIQYYMSADSG